MAWLLAVNNRIIHDAHAQGVLDRETNTVHLFERAARTKKATDMPELALDDPKLPELITDELFEQLLEDVEMLDG